LFDRDSGKTSKSRRDRRRDDGNHTTGELYAGDMLADNPKMLRALELFGRAQARAKKKQQRRNKKKRGAATTEGAVVVPIAAAPLMLASEASDGNAAVRGVEVPTSGTAMLAPTPPPPLGERSGGGGGWARGRKKGKRAVGK
jgi:hypothetical protein